MSRYQTTATFADNAVLSSGAWGDELSLKLEGPVELRVVAMRRGRPPCGGHRNSREGASMSDLQPLTQGLYDFSSYAWLAGPQ
jgi:hypothetical protein